MTNRLRLAFATHSVFGGGAELALLDLVRLLVADGHAVLVLAPLEGPLTARLEAAGARVVVTPLRWWASVHARPLRQRLVTPASLAARTAAVRRIVADFRPHVAVTNTIATPALAVAAKLLRVPHLWLLHEYALAEQGLFLDLPRRTTYRIAGRLSEELVAASHSLAREVRDLGAGECDVLYASVPAVPGALPRVVSQGPPYQLLSLGHVTSAKRQDELVRSLPLLRADGADWRLVLVGRRDPDFELELRTLAAALDVADGVAFVEETSEPGPWLASSHALVSASRLEACPRVVVEAMKSSLRVVACDSSGNAELLAEGRGWLYPPGDERELARAITAAVLANGATEAAARWAQYNFSAEGYLSTFLRFAQRAVA